MGSYLELEEESRKVAYVAVFELRQEVTNGQTPRQLQQA